MQAIGGKLASLWQNWKSPIILGGFVAIGLLILWSANAFAQLRLALNNAYFIPTDVRGEILIVAIDDASLAEYGRSPAEWSRTLYGDFVKIAADNEARVVAFDLIFSESTDVDSQFADALNYARQSSARTRLILAGAGAGTPATTLISEGFPDGLHYDRALVPNDSLRPLADYIGYVNAFPDIDSRLRRQPSIIEVGEEIRYSFSVAVFFAQRRIPASAISQLISAQEAQLSLTEELHLPVDDNGLWLQNYFGAPFQPGNSVFPVLSFKDIIEENIDTSILRDKIVLLGLIDSLGATDQYLVPSSASGALMSGVEIQANAIESLLQNVILVEQSSNSQAVMIVVLSLLSSAIFNRPRWYFKLVIWLVLIVSFLVLAFLLFSTQHLMLNLFYGGSAITIPAILTIGLEVSREINRRRRTEFLLGSVVQISEQQMDLDNILPAIANDVRQIVPDSSGFVWIYPTESRTTPKEQHWRLPIAQTQNQTLELLAHRAMKNRLTIHDNASVAVPIVWQDSIYGVMTVQASNRLRMGIKQISLLEDLARRLAPALDNASLHRSLDQQNRLLELILSESPASVVVLNQQYELIRCNTIFGLWMAKTSDEVLSQNIFDLFSMRGVEEKLCKQIEAGLKRGLAFDLQIEDALRHSLHLSVAPITQVGHWVMILNDVTELVQLNLLKTQMIRMASHDLKNPLARVLGYSEIILTDNVLDGTHKRFMQNIMNAGDEINQIITDILDLEQLRSGKIELKSTSFKQLVREIVSRYEPDLDRKRQELQINMLDAPITIMADHHRLGQAISNLVGNAIKYTPEDGQIEIRIWQVDALSVQLDIKDNGIGIPKASQERLFTEFYRVKSKATQGISGTGLGLSLVKSVVEAHEGTVWVESEEGEGSTFFVKLPIVTLTE